MIKWSPREEPAQSFFYRFTDYVNFVVATNRKLFERQKKREAKTSKVGFYRNRIELDKTPKAVKQQVEWLYDKACLIDADLHHNGKEIAKWICTSEVAVSHWICGGHSFTLSSLAKNPTALGKPMVLVAHC